MSDYDQAIWNYLQNVINNDYGVAGLMGNLQAESGLIPYRLQGDFTSGYSKSLQYTQDVDSGVISRSQFANDGKGYGLAQWTFYTRKYDLYDDRPINELSIGSLDRQLPFLSRELFNSYNSVWNTLVNATSIRQASNAVLHDFENPADQSVAVEEYRESLGQAIYDRFHTGPGPTPPGPDPPGPIPITPIPKWLLIKMCENQQN